MANSEWSTGLWESKTIRQIPDYEDKKELNWVKDELKKRSPLISFSEIMEFKDRLKNIEKNNAFIAQGGDCAESFANFSGENILKTIGLFEKIKNIISQKNIIPVGRIAGQFAKPRSGEFELVCGKKIHSYRGDIINSHCAFEEDRLPTPNRMLDAYAQSKETIKIIDSKIYTSHEALLLHYEESLIRKSDDDYYLSSTHLPWIGARTCYSNDAHVEFLRGVVNPIGIKCGADKLIDDLRKIIDILNPKNKKGKIILISRLGSNNISLYLPRLIKMVRENNFNVIWMCDPMHGNTKRLDNGCKVRHLKDIIYELEVFFEICKSFNIYAGGVHLEMTADDVLECIDGENLNDMCYKSLCDPRLNEKQALDVFAKLKKLFN